jgi:hypothetical protein
VPYAKNAVYAWTQWSGGVRCFGYNFDSSMRTRCIGDISWYPRGGIIQGSPYADFAGSNCFSWQGQGFFERFQGLRHRLCYDVIYPPANNYVVIPWNCNAQSIYGIN